MGVMEDFEERLENHEDRLKSLEGTRADTLKALSDMDTKHELRLNDVKRGLEERLVDLKKETQRRDDENSERSSRIEKKVDGLGDKMDEIGRNFAKAIRQTPVWVWPVITAILTIAGWFIGKKG